MTINPKKTSIHNWHRQFWMVYVFFPCLLVYYRIGKIPFNIAGGFRGVEALQAQSQRLHAIFYGIPLILIVINLLLKKFISTSMRVRFYNAFEKYMFLYFVVWGVYVTINGLILNNNTYYLVGDLFKLLVIPFAFYFTIEYLPHQKTAFIFIVISIVHIIYVLYGFSLNLSQLVVENIYKRQVYSSLFLICLFLVLSTAKNINLKNSLLSKIFLVILIIAHFLTFSRSTLLLIITSLGLIFFIIRKIYIIPKIFTFIFLGAFVFSLLSVFLPEGLSPNLPLSRLSDLYEKKFKDITTMGRIYEAKSAIDTFKKKSAFFWFVGLGSGAFVNLREHDIPPNIMRFRHYFENNEGKMHNIHIGYISVLFRSGIVGLFLFVIMLWKILEQGLKSIKLSLNSFDKMDYIICSTITLYIALTIIKFGITYIFIGDLEWGVLLGILALRWNHMRSKIIVDKLQNIGSSI